MVSGQASMKGQGLGVRAQMESQADRSLMVSWFNKVLNSKSLCIVNEGVGICLKLHDPAEIQPQPLQIVLT